MLDRGKIELRSTFLLLRLGNLNNAYSFSKDLNLNFKNDPTINNSIDLNSNSSTGDSPQNSVISPSGSPNVNQPNDQVNNSK